ncbi:hypothetical protein ILUMI_12788 [Ignelater luminosus]|uniref:Uncharacterized protein n=1 Tax=Ignelater luminosus TaxID=2038154 RepID=A0A8K0CTM6_IGNLU|nr:hypothetical protein ILUMI_12788 [Ignelater luminosus]
MHSREEGTFTGSVTEAIDGQWIYSDKSVRLRTGDSLYYWVKVDYFDGSKTVSHYKEDQTFIVAELIPSDGYVSSTSIPTTSSTYILTTTSTTEYPPCKETPTTVNAKPSCQGKLIFEEDFNELSVERWLTEVRFAGEPDYEFVIYNNDKENLYVEKKMLHIRPTLTEDKYGAGFVSKAGKFDLGESCTGTTQSFECVQKPKAWLILPPILSAQISTKPNFSFVYGVIEIRARLPRGDWIYPELFLKPKNNMYGLGYESGLLRIAFVPGNDDMSQQLSGGCVLGQTFVARNYAIKSVRSEKRWTNDFHVFKVEWKPDSIVLSVDDEIYGKINPPEGGFASEEANLGLDAEIVQNWKKGSQLAPFDKEMHLVLGVGVGGLCFSNTSSNKPWDSDDPKAQLHFYRSLDVWSKTWSDSSELVVDYIRIWAL